MQHNWTIAFDADDTLWHNERSFRRTQTQFIEMLADWAEPDALMQNLLAAEKRNLPIYGFGIKGFILSLVETAIDVTDGNVPQTVIAELMAMGRAMLADPVELLDGVHETIENLKPLAKLMVITKGDLLDQERKLAQSGLSHLFDRVEIVSDKTVSVYREIFADYDTPHQMMVGNSLRSDVIPALDAGLWGVHVPHDLTWEYETAEAPVAHSQFRTIDSLNALPALITSLSG